MYLELVDEESYKNWLEAKKEFDNCDVVKKYKEACKKLVGDKETYWMDLKLMSKDEAGKLLDTQKTKDGSRYNRDIKRASVISYTDAMNNHKWETNSETIGIYETGALNNGQHRCKALRESNVDNIFMWEAISKGSGNAIGTTVDLGNKRDVKTVLGFDDASVDLLKIIWEIFCKSTPKLKKEIKPLVEERGIKLSELPPVKSDQVFLTNVISKLTDVQKRLLKRSFATPLSKPAKAALFYAILSKQADAEAVNQIFEINGKAYDLFKERLELSDSSGARQRLYHFCSMFAFITKEEKFYPIESRISNIENWRKVGADDFTTEFELYSIQLKTQIMEFFLGNELKATNLKIA